MSDNNQRVVFIVDLKKINLHRLVDTLLNTYGQLTSHIIGRDAVRWFRGKRARDGAAPESGQEDPLREERY